MIWDYSLPLAVKARMQELKMAETQQKMKELSAKEVGLHAVMLGCSAIPTLSHVKQARCKSCGSSDFKQHNHLVICTYCRGAQ